LIVSFFFYTFAYVIKIKNCFDSVVPGFGCSHVYFIFLCLISMLLNLVFPKFSVQYPNTGH